MKKNGQSKLKKAEQVVKSVVGIIILFLIVMFFVVFIIGRTIVDGNSMFPTLHDGDQLIIERVTKKYDRYDIVVFSSPITKDEYLIKRVIGLPGENVRIDGNGRIYVNGAMLADDIYGAARIEDGGRAMLGDGVTLGKDEYFVMGDNRNRSEDSRFEDVGNIKRDQIKGRVVVRILPLETFGFPDLYRQRKGMSEPY